MEGLGDPLRSIHRRRHFWSPWKHVTAEQCALIRDDLRKAGLTINEEKSVLYPVQSGVWLGFFINTVDFSISIPKEKIKKLIELINHILGSVNSVSARGVAKIAGNIISMGPGIGDLTRLFTRKMYNFIDKSYSWDAKHKLDSGTVDEILFWKENLNFVNGYKIKENHAITKVVYTDASEHSYGGYILQKRGNVIAHGTFSNLEKGQSSTYRELAAVKNTLQSFCGHLRHHTVLWHSDNINVTRIINSGQVVQRAIYSQ